MRNDDPWKEIGLSPSESSLVGHLVLECRPHEAFRARDESGRRLLFLIHDRASETGTKLPTMAGLDVESRIRTDDGRSMLSVRLESDDDADIFTRFCEDIIATVATAESEVAAVQAFVGRTWKWHDLLRGARRKTLSRETQLGLMAELHTLLNVIAPVTGLGTAVEAWRGSEGAPKDFELSNLCIECKARGASSRAKVRITSEHQLADVPGHQVILIVNTFATGAEGEAGMSSLHDAVALLRSAVSSQRPDMATRIEAKLEDAGYENEHEYDLFAIHRGLQIFHVRSGFPRIVPGACPEGPVEVSYDLPLSCIASFEVSTTDLKGLLGNMEKHDG